MSQGEELTAIVFGPNGSRWAFLSGMREAIAKRADEMGGAQVLVARGERRQRWVRPSNESGERWQLAGQWTHGAALDTREEG